jgi:hypothetical protein
MGLAYPPIGATTSQMSDARYRSAPEQRHLMDQRRHSSSRDTARDVGATRRARQALGERAE